MSASEIVLAVVLTAIGLLAIWLTDLNHEACKPEPKDHPCEK